MEKFGIVGVEQNVNTSEVVTIVSHDAGGAEILASYVAQNDIACRFVLEGPAVNVFKRRLGEVEVLSLEEGISAGDWCLCGTGWQTDLEWRAIELMQNKGKRVVAFLDHWVNYQERFIRNGSQHFPDEIWVGDVDAEILARESFQQLPIWLIPNPYFLDIKRQLEDVNNIFIDKQTKDVLFVCENISDHARLRHGNERHWGYTEYDALNYFLKNINVLEEVVERVVIRPHPSDAPGKYDRILEAYIDIAKLSTGKPLIQEIAESDIVVGCESGAMVIGLLAQKKVFSCIPQGGLCCRLPQKDILHFRELVVK